MKFDDTIGSSTVVDSSGNGNTGTLVGGSLLEPSIVRANDTGNCIKLNGTSGYVDIGSGNNLDITGTSISMMAWIKLGSYTTGDTTGWNIMGRGSNTAPQYQFAIYIGISRFVFGVASSLGGGNLYNDYMGDVPNFQSATGYNAPNWMHVALIFGSGVATTYVNGILLTSKAWPYNIVSVASATNHIGRIPIVPGIGANGFFKGSIDGVKIYDNEISQSDLLTIYHAERPYYDTQIGPILNNSYLSAERPINNTQTNMFRTDLGTPNTRPDQGQMWPRFDD